jgi:hypothetical protein
VALNPGQGESRDEHGSQEQHAKGGNSDSRAEVSLSVASAEDAIDTQGVNFPVPR